MRRCSREGLKPEQSDHIPCPPAAPQGEGNPTWSSDGHQAGGTAGCAAPQGESLGIDKSIDRQEKGEKLLLTWRCRGKMNLGQGRSIN